MDPEVPPAPVPVARPQPGREFAAAVGRFPALSAVIALTLVSFGLQHLLGDRYTAALASDGDLVRQGEWWRLLSVVLVHVSVAHVAANMAVLLIWGRWAEAGFGRLRFLLVYVAAALGASVTSVVVHPHDIGVGASGAVFGVMGALAAYWWRRRHDPAGARQARMVAGYAVLSAVLAASMARVDNAAHVGGFLTGVALGWLLDRMGLRRARG